MTSISLALAVISLLLTTAWVIMVRRVRAQSDAANEQLRAFFDRDY